MGFEKALRDPLYAGSVAALACVAVIAGSLMLFSGESSADQAPAVTASPSPTNTPVPARATPTKAATPTYGDILADTQRLLELAKVRDALARYHDTNDAYPSTGGAFETLCEEPVDSGCELREVDPAVPSGFNTEPFWYQSDGSRYALFAQVATPQDDDCPDELPAALDGKLVACIQEGQP